MEAVQSNPKKPEKFYIKTFGCQMNEADSERMASLLSETGLSASETAEDADVIIINGCTVREKATHKAVSMLGRFQGLKKKGEKAPVIGIGGCVGQLEKDKFFSRAPYVDFVFGTDTIDHLPEMVFKARHGSRHHVYADFDRTNNYSTETKVYGTKSQAFVNIMKGCDKFCTYCIVPFTRGREKSRLIDEVVDDIAKLVERGVKEITLLGQNVNSFGKGNANAKMREPRELHNPIGKVGPREGEENFPQLLRALETDPRLKALKRLRFTSSHPLDFSDELIECYAPTSQGGLEKLAKHLHLPVQSGSNRVLQKMGRHHQIETYIEQMDRLREICPEVGLSTDLIVGFPGETEEEFQETLKLLDRVQYDNIYAFAYSPRPGTRAAKLVDDVPDDVKNRRLNELLQYQLNIAEKKYAQKIGQVMEVLVEGESKNQSLAAEGAKASTGAEIAPNISSAAKRVFTGRTTCGRVVNFITESPREMKGKFVSVNIVGATSLSLQGELVV